MMVELAIGDAYGSGFEFAAPDYVKNYNSLEGYFAGPRRLFDTGRYTDDTQMSIAVAEMVLSGDNWTESNLANRFVSTFKRDPRRGYAGGFGRLLREVADGRQLLEQIRPDSSRSGAAMRSAPIGIFASPDEVVEKTTIQAKITHNTPDGVTSAIAISLAAHYMIHNIDSKFRLFRYLEKYLPSGWLQRWSGPVSIEGRDCACAALTAVVMCDSLGDLLRTCVEFTGDADTVSCIAMAVGSCCSEIKDDLPSVLHEDLERGPFGYEYLVDLDQKLKTLMPQG